MVTITNAFQRKNARGETFNVLTIEGGITMIKSQTTGHFYAHTMKTNIIAALEFSSCLLMVGEKIDGEIIKQKCPPYEYTTPDGKKKSLNYTYAYQEESDSAGLYEQTGLVA